ncbi:CCL3 protein, partial [Geococcyx californianus]|nr:CCL3 protein [Geococcyx californianus]
ILWCHCLIMQLVVKCFHGHSQCVSLPFTAHFTPTECCFQYAQKPLRHMQSFYETSRDCSLPAVVILTASGAKVCANPTKLWVKKAIKNMQKKK